MFLKSLLTKICLITQSKNSGVVSVAHMKQCIESEKLFHFLRDLAERPSSAAQKDARGLSMWPLYRWRLELLLSDVIILNFKHHRLFGW
ncbi:hypothetical protein F7725_008275 [Dissostichus mawsoni]|uniref:Uncharacterized protein n=1 Tax=Dissostichus mawsoni TaxID=36200 RepID=A0A7J5Y6Q6_DISMA|nr:hypothetical protein F7725_008275 [Dissostichus mawsoni]